jgi:RNA polymerase sigma-70 factor, ECF subfamily
VTGEAIPNLGHEFAWSNDWVEAQSDYLFNFAVGQVRDPSIAEDLVQETFLAALKSKSLFLGKSAERTWLVGILRHQIHDYLRCRCRERAVPELIQYR